MFKQRLFIILAVFVSVLCTASAYAQLTQIQTGLNYLASSQSPEGFWGDSTVQVETTAATVSALEALKLLNETAGPSYSSGASWLQAQEPRSIEQIAGKILALNLTDVSVDALLPAFDLFKGGWGGYDGYAVNTLDTCLALKALKPGFYRNHER